MTLTTRDGRTLEVIDNPELSRFEAHVDAVLIGKAVYTLRDGLVVFTHTEVDPAMQGQGIANQLAGTALDLVRASGRRVVPLCPFISAYIGQHPEYADLVD
jgi:uncharacterized protein